MKLVEGKPYAIEGKRFAIVASLWNTEYTERLVQGALETLAKNAISDDRIVVCRVPGAFEIPVACRELATSGSVDGIVALGTLIKGETEHFKLICKAVTDGIMQTMLETGVPIGFGVITAKEESQANDRAGGKLGNLGIEAAEAALSMVSMFSRLNDNHQ